MNEPTSNYLHQLSQLAILWHRLLAKLMEGLLVPVNIRVLNELPATSVPPKIDLLLLRADGERWTESQRALLPDGIRDRHMANHLLECKITESTTEQGLQQTLTYDYLYRQSQQLAEDQLQSYIVSAKTPHPDKLADWGYVCKDHPGVYVSDKPLLRRLILLVLNDLRDLPHNNYFRLFASRKKVRSSALTFFAQQPQVDIAPDVLNVVIALQQAYQLEGVEMTGEIDFENILLTSESIRKSIIASATLEERLAGLQPEERLAGLQPEERLVGLQPEERLAGLRPEERLVGLQPEERLAGLPPKERLVGLQPEERLDGLKPEERLAGLESEELLALMKQIERYLQMPGANPTSVDEQGQSAQDS